ncbi:TPA: hypothetical protein N0F65_000669, partial [Lagenidium giganteum]
VEFLTKLPADSDLSGNDISHFELRESDVDILEKLTDFRVGAMATPTCNAQATKKDMDIVGNNYQFCVISNSAFDTLYNTTRTKAKATPGSAWMVPMILTTASLAVLVFFAGLYVISKRSSNEYEKGVGSGGRRRISSPPASQGYLPDDVRQDADLVQRRIPLNDLVRGRLIGKGGYGTIHLARWIKNDTDNRVRPKFVSDCPAEIRYIALECLSHDPAARPTANELYESLVALNFAADRKQARVSRASKSEAERVHL